MDLRKNRRIRGNVLALYLSIVMACVACIAAVPAFAQDRMVITAEQYDGYGRIVLNFPSRFGLPPYKLGSENGVLLVLFEETVAVSLPDVSGSMPDYITVARLDPDRKGIRLGLKGAFQVNPTEAGEKLFIDILPENWTGMMPSLPPEVIAELNQRSVDAAIAAERKRRADIVATQSPNADIRVGRHPTFTRVQMEWSIETEGRFDFTDGVATIAFDWPMAVDLYNLKIDLPAGILDARNEVDEDGTKIILEIDSGVEPRFYANSATSFILDIDQGVPEGDTESGGMVDVAELLPEGENRNGGTNSETMRTDSATQEGVESGHAQTELTPVIEESGNTVRVRFPFEQDTPAAVFRRANTVWLVFDTAVAISTPPPDTALARVAQNVSLVPSGNATIMRVDLSQDRLATLGSEGRSWVLSLGDLLLTPSEVMSLSREQNSQGLFQMIADVARPSRIHEIRDPEVGDILEVITLYPPARGLIRDLSYVDFSALRSVHGLVVRPNHEDVHVELLDTRAIISADRGLIISSPSGSRGLDSREESIRRDGFIDLSALYEGDPEAFQQRRRDIMMRAASSESRELDTSRLQLAQFYLANDLSYEAIGVLEVMRDELTSMPLKGDLELTLGAATTLAGRPRDALDILNQDSMAASSDALMWRTIARVDAGDHKNARTDALSAEAVFSAYPPWVRTKFLFAAIEAALETNDNETARRFIAEVQTSRLAAESLSRYQLFSARLDEADGKYNDALDTYGQVISTDIRPTRAEAIYRTILVLDKMDRLDSVRAAETISTELTTWRGTPLEAKMQKLQAELFFRRGDFRQGFEVVREMSRIHAENDLTSGMLEESKGHFSDLYLDGKANAMEPIDALTLYYDFRQLTPPGARGDEMVRNLARRLINVDLLTDAANLLQYQIDERLRGAARAQVAADLAIIYLANKNPHKALEALNNTRSEGLPPALVRQRRLLEAKALIDAGRDDLSLEIMRTLDGRDADLLRVEALWSTSRFREAAEVLETMFASTDDDELSEIAQRGIVRSAVGYVLADDRIGLSRLRGKYAERMSQTPHWPIFSLVTGETNVSSLEFQQVAHDVADVDSLKEFIATYRNVYGTEGALTPDTL